MKLPHARQKPQKPRYGNLNLNVQVGELTVKTIDRLRGDLSRGQWVRRAIDEKVERDQ